MNDVLHLFRLQQIDSLVFASEKEIAALTSKFESDRRIQEAKRNLDDQQSRLYKKELELKQVESALHDLNLKLEFNQTSLYSGKVKSPKELQDLQLEAYNLRKNISSSEDRQFELLMDVEENSNILENFNKVLSMTTSLVQQEFSKDTARLNSLKSQIDNQHIERNAVVSQIPAEILSQYETLKSRKNGVAVASIEDNACNRCGAPVTAAEKQRIRTSPDLTFCSACGRVLYSN